MVAFGSFHQRESQSATHPPKRSVGGTTSRPCKAFHSYAPPRRGPDRELEYFSPPPAGRSRTFGSSLILPAKMT